MPYALESTISLAPLDGGIEITEQQYTDARAAKLSGREALVLAGEIVIRDPAPSPDHIWEDGEWVAPEPVEPEPTDPLTLSLSKRQVNAALILAGHTDPDAFIETAIATITDDTARALALNDWRFAPYYKREHPLLNDPDILTAAGFTPDDVDDLWAVAAQQDR
ncbi:MAG: hypothetical protein CML24_14605 [Rhizobiales bacterium]|mgnify:CR=1 FL=1|nr:hypothetical protein [Hyphomicrobiales bacterium]|tara:strand:+ start:1709 stop:2200 length:492 start_codon:yes stop_codon:yes gene_type:complete